MKTHVSILAVLLVGLFQNNSFSTKDSSSEIVITSVDQADALVRATQEQFWQLFPPSDDWLYVHSEKKVRPVIWSSGWPNVLKKQMYAEMRAVNGNLYPVYTLWAEADRISGDLTYYNMFGQPVWISSAPLGYTPLSPVLDRYGVKMIDELSESQQEFNASSIGLELQLIPDGFQEPYEQDVVLERQAITLSSQPMMMAMSAPPPPGGTSTNSSGGGGYQTASVDYGDDLYLDQNLSLSEDGWLDIHNAEIGQEYEIYYTYNLQYVPFDTNTPSYYTAWPAKIGLIGESDGVAYWSAPLVGENALNRAAAFFRAYEFSDSDGDGLSDIYELMITKTSHTNAMSVTAGVLDSDLDQDSDGLSNYEEYLGLGKDVYTHPRIPDTDNDNKNDDVDPWPMDGAGAEDTDRDRMPDVLYQNRTSTSYPMLIADLDDDNDRFSDLEENAMGSDSKDPTSPGSYAYLDTDGDGLYDWEETEIYNSSISNPDHDGDGIGDGYEEKVLGNSATSPNSYTQAEKDAYAAVSVDVDLDGKPEWIEGTDSTNPNDGLDFSVNIF